MSLKAPGSTEALGPTRGGVSGTVDVISALQRQDGQFATQEQRVADYVKANLENIGDMTIADLARHCDVSKPTVVRFCRTLGCDGYREFKLRLAQNLAVSMQYLSASTLPMPVTGGSAFDQVFGAIHTNAMAMREQLDQDMFMTANSALLETRHLLFAGIGGGSSTVSQEGANRFFRLGVPTFTTSDSYILQMRAATLRPGDVLFVISASGEADAIVGAVEIANGYGATTICVTKPNTRLAKAARIPLLVNLPEDPDIYKPTASRYIHMMIVDALALTFAQQRSQETTENLRRIRASLTAYHGRTGPQPLGD